MIYIVQNCIEDRQNSMMDALLGVTRGLFRLRNRHLLCILKVVGFSVMRFRASRF
jgi:hypothetical protein